MRVVMRVVMCFAMRVVRSVRGRGHGTRYGGRTGVQRGQLRPQPTVYILVHLDVPVRREVVRIGETLQPGVHRGVAGGGPHDPQGRGLGGLEGGHPEGRPPAPGVSAAGPSTVGSGSSGVLTGGAPASGVQSLMPKRYRDRPVYRRARWRPWLSAAAH